MSSDTYMGSTSSSPTSSEHTAVSPKTENKSVITGPSPNASLLDLASAGVGAGSLSSSSSSNVLVDATLAGQLKKNKPNVAVTTRQQFVTATPKDLGTAYAPVYEYFYKRFIDQCKAAGGYDGMLLGWKVQLLRVSGAVTTSGVLDVNYESSKGRHFPNIVSAMMAMSLTPNARSAKGMSRVQHALVAAETLDKALVSQGIHMTGGRADVIAIDANDSSRLTITVRSETDQKAHWSTIRQLGTTVVPADEEIAGLEAVHASGTTATVSLRPSVTTEYTTCEDSCRFKFGQACTILSFGTIIPDAPKFHSVSAIYPLGFRCVRIEHDVILGRTVECLCEIMAVDADDTGTFDSATMEWKGKDLTDKAPLFRITVGWQVGPEGSRRMVPKVYQALTQAEAWEGAMTETFGTSEFDNLPTQSADDMETPDVEEQKCQADYRREYFAGLTMTGVRLALDSKECTNIIEDGVQRYIEGLSDAVNCSEYEFIGAREADGGKKFSQRACAKVIEKAIRLARVVSGNANQEAKRLGAVRAKPRKRDSAGNLIPNESEETVIAKDKPSVADGDVVPAAATAVATVAKVVKPKVTKVKVVREREVLPPIPPPITTSYNITVPMSEGGSRDSTGMNSERRSRAKDVDRLVRLHKETFQARIMKKRSNDAKDRVKLICDNEEKEYLKRVSDAAREELKENGSLPGRSLRPDPLHGLVKMHGTCFTQVLELWEFLTTYHKVFNLQQVPSLDTLVSALKLCDPAYSAYQNETVFPVTPATTNSATNLSKNIFEQPQHRLQPGAAAELLNKIGMLLTEVLRPEYERIMGVDVACSSIGGLNVPVNLLTWREIARTVLVHGMTRESGYSETDAVNYIKGRGFVYVPDGGDKKILKLIRKRINWQRNIALDYQESLVGFTSGIVARLPQPGFHRAEEVGLQWREMLLRLIHVAHTCPWLVYETIESAYQTCDGYDEDKTNEVRQTLARCLAPDMILLHDASKAKLAALAVLEIDSGTAKGNPRVKLGCDIARAYIKECEMNGNIAAAAPQISLETHYKPNSASRWDPSRYNNDIQRRLGTATTRTTLVDLNSEGIVGSIGVGLDQTKQAAILGADGEPVGSTTYFTGTTHVSIFGNDDEDEEEEGEEAKSSQRKQQPWRFNINYTDELDAQDAEAYDRLSVGSCRCLELLKSLMRNPQLVVFNWPIDSLAMPQYYAHISCPLCLFDIRRHLVAGGYENNITGFYCDINIIFENALSYNPENSQLSILTQKAIILFERLFFEQVIHWEYPLQAADTCHICRAGEAVDPVRCVTCDRCEALFHLHCVTPPLNRVPKGDWLCSFCVEQRSVSEVHPNKVAAVQHPNNPHQKGHVLAIDQDHKKLRFIVFFPETSQREVWTGDKVRKYARAYHDHCKATIMARDRLSEKDYVAAAMTCSSAVAATRALAGEPNVCVGRANSEPANPLASFGELKECLADWMPVMPSGYDIDDFDTVCGLARGYTGMQVTHHAIPCHLHDSHNFKAKHKASADPYFDRCRRAIATLSSAEEPHTPGAMEWLSVLRSLMQRLVGSPPIIDATGELDDAAAAAAEAAMLAIKEGRTSKAVLVRDCGVQQGNTLLQYPSVSSKADETIVKASELASSTSSELDVKADDLLGDGWDEATCRDALNKITKLQEAAKSEAAAAAAAAAAESGTSEVKSESSSAMVVAPPPSDFATHHLIALLRKRRHGGTGKSERLTDDDARHILWELRRMSRYKARDDALQLHGLLADIMNSVDLDCVREVRPEDLVVAMASPIPSKPAVSIAASPSGASATSDPLAALALVASEVRPSQAAPAPSAAVVKPPVPEATGPLKSLYNLVANIIVRQSIPKIVDALDLDEWAEWWEASMVQLSQAGIDILEEKGVQAVLPPMLYTVPKNESQPIKQRRHEDYHQTCAFCQQREPYLASHFVYGQTWEEWEAEADMMGTAFEKGPKWEPSYQKWEPAASGGDDNLSIGNYKLLVTTMQGYAASTVALLEPFLDSARKKCQWAVVDTAIRTREENEVANNTVDTVHYRMHPPRRGSKIVHEVCMEHMQKCREATLPRTRRRDTTNIIEVLTGIGRGKSKPLGADHAGGRYWVFAGSPFLFVSSPPAHITLQNLMATVGAGISKDKQGNVVRAASIQNLAEGTSSSNATAASEGAHATNPQGPSESFKEQYFTSVGHDPEGAPSGAGGLTWVAYRDEWDISRLMRWLDITHDSERQIRKALEYLFPNAANLALKKNDEKPEIDPEKNICNTYIASSDGQKLNHFSDDESGDDSSDGDSEDGEGTHGMEVAEGDNLQDTESEDGGDVHVISSVRRAARKATDLLQAQARADQYTTKVKRHVEEMDDTASEGEGNALPGFSVDGADGGPTDEAGNPVKPVRILHPDDEPKRRGRPQQMTRVLEHSAVPAGGKDGKFAVGPIVPPTRQLEFVSYRLTEGVGNKRYPNKSKDFNIGDRVLVQNSINGILWDARVLKVRRGYYPSCKVRFDHWGAAYDAWVDPKRMASPTDSARVGRKYRRACTMKHRSYAQHAQNDAWYFPEPICQLRAAAVLEDMDLQGLERAFIGFSDAKADNPLGMLRAALLVVEAALPDLSKDENEEKWGKGVQFARCWRESVAQAKDASDLMNALMILEYSLKISWLKPTGMKLMGCMPSRNILCRRATLGQVAARLWILDATVRYEKNPDLVDSGKNVADTFLRHEIHAFGGRAGPSTGQGAEASSKTKVEAFSTEETVVKMEEE